MKYCIFKYYHGHKKRKDVEGKDFLQQVEKTLKSFLQKLLELTCSVIQAKDLKNKIYNTLFLKSNTTQYQAEIGN